MAKKKSTYIPRNEVLDINKEINAVREKAAAELMKIPGVVQVGVGLKVSKGELQRKPCFKVTVKKKLDKKDINDKNLIPPTVFGFETDVDEIEENEIIADKYRPLIGGCQIQISTASWSGTLGCYATRNADNRIVLLSNYHVLVSSINVFDARVGQPTHSGCCSCCSCNEIATVTAGSVQGNNMDAAIALLHGQDDDTIPEHKYLNEILDIGHIAGSAAPQAMETVWKTGRTTGWTEGQIINDNYPSSTIYDSYDGITENRNTFRIQQHARHPKFSESGDSGSVIVNEHNQAVLLLFAKVSADNNGVATPIPAIEAELEITILDSTFHENATDANGAPARGVPLSAVAPAPVKAENMIAAFTRLEDKIKQSEDGKKLLKIFEKHREEALHLVNSKREAMAAWNRYQGPEFLAHIVRSIRRDNKPVPENIKGVSLQNLLLKMTAVLKRHGSPELVKDLNDHYLEVLGVFSAGNTPKDWIEKISSIEKTVTT